MYRTIQIVCCILLFVKKSHTQNATYSEEVLKLPFKQLIESLGYPLEEHTITTTDGYVLITHRIPHGRNTTITSQKPVLFVHGMGGSSENIFVYPYRSLGYLLADAGYDVWMMNSRGNYYGRKHIKLNPDEKKFWLYSWHQIGTIDVANNIDYILNVTNQSQLSYIGHSQGCTSYFVLTSEKPEYNKKIRLHVSLAPPVFLQLSDNRVGNIFSQFISQIEYFTKSMHLYQCVDPEVFKVIKEQSVNKSFREIAYQILHSIDGLLPGRYTVDIVPFLLRVHPYGTSIFQMIHYLQIIQLNSFRKFDFGPKSNKRRYGSELPPEYQVNKSSAPAYLMYGPKDFFATEDSTKYLAKQLPNVTLYRTPVEDFSHLDFIIAADAKELVYDPLIEYLNGFYD